MTYAVYKYPLNHGTTLLELPTHARVLRVGVQGPDFKPFLWALVSTKPDWPTMKKAFKFYATGAECLAHPDSYVGTVEIDGGTLIFHLFEVSLALFDGEKYGGDQ